MTVGLSGAKYASSGIMEGGGMSLLWGKSEWVGVVQPEVKAAPGRSYFQLSVFKRWGHAF